MRKLMMMIALLCLPTLLRAGQDDFRLAVPQALADSGLMRHLLPRFTLKHRVRITQVPQGAPAEAAIGTSDTGDTGEGVPVFAGLGQTWVLTDDGSAGPARFADWLQSEVGRNTVASFGGAAFTADIAPEAPAVVLSFEGDPVAGKRLSFDHCGRCHVIDDSNRMNGMGATPSFGMLRTLPDWSDRFTKFYSRNPHPSFTQVSGVTRPFDPAHPPPIVPMQITPTDIDAILAFVATLAPADLGAPIQSQ